MVTDRFGDVSFFVVEKYYEREPARKGSLQHARLPGYFWFHGIFLAGWLAPQVRQPPQIGDFSFIKNIKTLKINKFMENWLSKNAKSQII